MILTVSALILFTLSKMAEYYNRKYDGMDDLSRVSTFINTYWRVANATPPFLFGAAMLCGWIEVRSFPVAQMLVAILLFFCVFSMICRLALFIAETLEAVFGIWDDSSLVYEVKQTQRDISDWLQSLRKDTTDVVWSTALNVGSIGLLVVLFWNMTSTLITSNFVK